MEIAYKSRGDKSIDQIDRFRILSSEIAALAANEDLSIVPFVDPELVHFSSLSLIEQKEVLQQLETLLFICQQIQDQGGRIRSVKTLTWAFLKHFQCVAPSDLLGHMEDTDFVDAYGISHKMLFAALTFFEVFTYSLEEFFCRTWVELFSRNDEDVQKLLYGLSQDMVMGKHINIVSSQFIPAHECFETSSEQQRRVRVEPQFFSPLFSKGSVIGYLCVNRGTIIS